MDTSRVIEIDGIFVGAAVTLPDGQGWRIVAASERVDQVNGSTAATFQDARRLAHRAFLTSRRTLAHARPGAAAVDPGKSNEVNERRQEGLLF